VVNYHPLVVEYHPQLLIIIQMNIVFLSQISAAAIEFCPHQMDIICCNLILSAVGENHPIYQIIANIKSQ
jgi:hypothetical protein